MEAFCGSLNMVFEWKENIGFSLKAAFRSDLLLVWKRLIKLKKISLGEKMQVKVAVNRPGGIGTFS
jgi:hypothetical protein